MPPLQVKKRGPIDWSALAFLLAISGANLFIMLFILPKFQQIYADMLGPKANSSPSPTFLLIHWRFLFESLAFAWPAIGILTICRASIRIARLSVSALILAALIQAGFTTIALFLPLAGVIIQATPASPTPK
jgi:hypothetical protein